MYCFRHLLIALAGVAGVYAVACADRSPLNHKIHDPERAQPPVVVPGEVGEPVPAPSDAIILFDGSSFDAWRGEDGAKPGWKIVDGAMEVVPGEGDIQTAQTFGDVQLHIEFKTNPESRGSAQHRSNSGVFFGSYEVQILDSYENATYADGIVGSIYGQYPPLVNAARPPGEWQTFDIVYRAPAFGERGKVEKPARITVFHNGILVQDNEELIGPTSHAVRMRYRPHADVPIRLQDHRDDPLFFRNIWLRELTR